MPHTKNKTSNSILCSPKHIPKNISLFGIEATGAFLFVLTLFIQKRILLFDVIPAFEWGSAYIYVSDIFFCLVIGVWGIRLLQNKATIPHSPILPLVGLFICTIFISIIFADHTLFATFGAIKMLQAGILFIWAYSTNISKYIILVPFIIGGIFSGLLGVAQFYLQKSVGLTMIAESPLKFFDPEVAHIAVSSGRFIRAYGSLPSPNILAFFLVIAILFLIFLYYRRYIRFAGSTALAMTTLTLALTLSFSRGVMVIGYGVIAALLVGLWHSSKDALRTRAQNIGVITCLAVVAMSGIFIHELYDRFFVNVYVDHAVEERVVLNNSAVDVIKDNPQGVGVRHFALHTGGDDPVHNVFLLIASEIGIIGVALFIAVLLWFFWRVATVAQKRMLTPEHLLWVAVMLCIVALSLIDHFFFTLQHGIMIFWLFLGLAIRSFYTHK